MAAGPESANKRCPSSQNEIRPAMEQQPMLILYPATMDLARAESVTNLSVAGRCKKVGPSATMLRGVGSDIGEQKFVIGL